MCCCAPPWGRNSGTVAAYAYWLFKEGDLEFAMSGLKNARMLQVRHWDARVGEGWARL